MPLNLGTVLRAAIGASTSSISPQGASDGDGKKSDEKAKAGKNIEAVPLVPGQDQAGEAAGNNAFTNRMLQAIQGGAQYGAQAAQTIAPGFPGAAGIGAAFGGAAGAAAKGGGDWLKSLTGGGKGSSSSSSNSCGPGGCPPRNIGDWLGSGSPVTLDPSKKVGYDPEGKYNNPVIETISSVDDYNKAQANAKAEGKTMVANFSATWCGACKGIDLQGVASKFDPDKTVFYKIDADSAPDLLGPLNVTALPTSLVIKGDQKSNIGGAGNGGIESAVYNTLEDRVEKEAAPEKSEGEPISGSHPGPLPEPGDQEQQELGLRVQELTLD